MERIVGGALQGGRPYTFDHRIVLPDGSERTVHMTGEVVMGSSGKPARLVGTIQDVTEQRRNEEELRVLSHRLVEVQEEERRNVARECTTTSAST